MKLGPEKAHERKSAVSWAMYDWANSAFATTVMAGFFPIFFKQYWSAGIDVHVSTFHLGSANSIASITVALLAPILGFVADKGAAKKKFLLFFLMMGVISTGMLAFIGKGEWARAAACYALATVGFAGGNVFYDSLLVSVARKEKMDCVSALGYGLGYLGGGLLSPGRVLCPCCGHRTRAGRGPVPEQVVLCEADPGRGSGGVLRILQYAG